MLNARNRGVLNIIVGTLAIVAVCTLIGRILIDFIPKLSLNMIGLIGMVAFTGIALIQLRRE